MKTSTTLTPEARTNFEAALDLLAKQADRALSRSDIDAHTAWGRRYHTLADTLFQIYGVELRPSEQLRRDRRRGHGEKGT